MSIPIRQLAYGLVLPLSVLALPVDAYKLYKWIDADGKVTYQDQPPPTDSGVIEERELSVDTTAAPAQAAPGASAVRGETIEDDFGRGKGMEPGNVLTQEDLAAIAERQRLRDQASGETTEADADGAQGAEPGKVLSEDDLAAIAELQRLRDQAGDSSRIDDGADEYAVEEPATPADDELPLPADGALREAR